MVQLPIADLRLPIFKQKPDATKFITSGLDAIQNFKSQIRVTRREHRGEPRDFFLATALLARLFKMPMSAHDFERALAVDFLLQPPQRTIHRFAFFQSYFSQRNSLPFQRNLAFREFKMGAQSGLSAPFVNE